MACYSYFFQINADRSTNTNIILYCYACVTRNSTIVIKFKNKLLIYTDQNAETNSISYFFLPTGRNTITSVRW